MQLNSKKFWTAVVIFSLVGQVAWVVENMYFNVFIYEMFRATPTQISTMVAASAISATVTTLLVGALSDKVGKRKIFMCAGYIAWGLSILVFALIRVDVIMASFPTISLATANAIGVTLVIIFDCVMTFFGSSANDAAYNAWLTDMTNENNRGKAEGVNSMMPLVAILVVFGGFMSFDLSKPKSWSIIFIVIGAVVLLIGVLGIFLIQDSKISTTENQNYFKNILYGFRPSVVKKNKNLYLYLIAFALFGISIQIFMPYLIIYYEVSLGFTDYVLIFAPAIVIASIFTVFTGRIYDRFKFNNTIFPVLFIMIIGFVFLAIFKAKLPVFIGSLFMMCGYLGGMAVFGAVIRECTPENKSGMLQGIRIVGQVLIPGIIGPYIGSFVLRNAEKFINTDGTESFIPNNNIFIAAAIVAVLLVGLLFVLTKIIKKNNERIETSTVLTNEGEN